MEETEGKTRFTGFEFYFPLALAFSLIFLILRYVRLNLLAFTFMSLIGFYIFVLSYQIHFSPTELEIYS